VELQACAGVPCRRPMAMPPGPRAVMARSGGMVSSATISEWQRAAGKGWGRPASSPRPSWVIGDAWPRTGQGAVVMVAPEATAMAW